jgi:glycosyltransferase involved in cell wall biosynthesis
MVKHGFMFSVQNVVEVERVNLGDLQIMKKYGRKKVYMNNNYASLCVLSYNRLDFLKQTLSTALNNTNLPLEVIVHDDGSYFVGEENQGYQIRRYLCDLLESKLISSVIFNPPGKNEGQGRALNKLFNCASGDILIAVDQDLIFKIGWLETTRSILDGSTTPSGAPGIGSLGGFRYNHDPVDHEKMFIHNWGKFEEHQDYVGSYMAFSRKGWERFGPFEEYSDAFAEDAVIKREIFETDNWCNALPPKDIVENQGFGVGPSTVVAKQESGKVGVTKIHKEPNLIG